MIRTNWLERWALYTPNKVAIIDDATGRSFTYQQFFEITNRLSCALQQEYQIGKGDRVAALSQNCIEYVFLFFAVQQIDAILVPVNFRLAAREIDFVLKDCQPKLLVVQTEYESLLGSLDSDNLPARRFPMVSATSADVMRLGTDERYSAARPSIDVPFESACMILYTSGTTGAPKGALITHEMMFWNSINTTMRLNIVSDDVTPIFTPFFHTGGWHVLTTPFIHRGATIIFMNSFKAERVVELCENAGVTILFGVPTMMKMMSETPQFASASFTKVRYAIVGGEPMPIPQIELWQSKGVPIRQGYGLTEVGPNVYSLPEEDAIRKKGSIGFPNFYVDAKVVDDAGNECGVDEPGELLMRSPVVTPGYWNNPAATEQVIRDGWFHTGDIVRKDSEGYYYVIDRKKDMYISGAENVYPAEVEHFLRTHPAISDVAIVGVPDPKWGEVGKAFIVLKPDAFCTIDEIRNFCTGNLAKYKIPKHFEFLKELPKGDSGKILKRALKEFSR
jgi:fatty-acyl-CoA synthase